jgi:hypothetical protein
MNGNRLENLGRAALVLLLGAAFSGCTLGPITPSPELSERIEAALQHSDHDGLIAYYKAEAAAARDKMIWHRRLAASYGDLSSARTSPRMAARCDSIAWMYEEIAVEYDGMAQFHQLLAREPALSKPKSSSTETRRESAPRISREKQRGI